MSDKIRVLRIIEYVGEREWVEDTLKKSIQQRIDTPRGSIKVATIDIYPEVFNDDSKSGGIGGEYSV